MLLVCVLEQIAVECEVALAPYVSNLAAHGNVARLQRGLRGGEHVADNEDEKSVTLGKVLRTCRLLGFVSCCCY